MKFSQVDAVLNRGRIYPSFLVWMFRFILIISLFGIIAGIACFFVDEYSVAERVEGIVTVVLGFGIFIGLTLFFLIPYHKLKKIVKKCLADPDATVTTAKCLDISANDGSNLKFVNGSRIQVEFRFNEKLYKRKSDKKGKSILFNGHDKAFTKFIDKTIDIIYSPMYDEVLLIKSKYF